MLIMFASLFARENPGSVSVTTESVHSCFTVNWFTEGCSRQAELSLRRKMLQECLREKSPSSSSFPFCTHHKGARRKA